MATPALNPLVEKVRAMHPGAYDDIDDATLTKKVLAKYPQYSDLAAPPASAAPGGPKSQPKMDSGEGPIASGLTSFETRISELPKNLWRSSFFGEIGNPEVKAEHERRIAAMDAPGWEGVKNTASAINPVETVDGSVDWGATGANLLPLAIDAGQLVWRNAGPVVRATARGVNRVLEHPGAIGGTVGSGAGAAVGHATGIPYMGAAGAGVGGAAGGFIGGKLPKIRIPGEGFGLPNRVIGGPAEAPPYNAGAPFPETPTPEQLSPSLSSPSRTLPGQIPPERIAPEPTEQPIPGVNARPSLHRVAPSRGLLLSGEVSPEPEPIRPIAGSMVRSIEDVSNGPERIPSISFPPEEILPRMRSIASSFKEPTPELIGGEERAPAAIPPSRALRVGEKIIDPNEDLTSGLEDSLRRVPPKVRRIQ